MANDIYPKHRSWLCVTLKQKKFGRKSLYMDVNLFIPASITIGQSMAVWADEHKILKSVVKIISIDMMKFQRNEAVLPFSKSALLTSMLF